MFCFLTSPSFQGPRMFTQSCNPSSSTSAAPLWQSKRRCHVPVFLFSDPDGRKSGFDFCFFVCSLDHNWAISALTSVLTYCFESHGSCGLLLYTYMAFRLAGTGMGKGFRYNEWIILQSKHNFALGESTGGFFPWGITQCCFSVFFWLFVWKSGEISVNVQWCDFILFCFFFLQLLNWL